MALVGYFQELYLRPKFKQSSEKMTDEAIFEEIKMRRLVPKLRERVGLLRAGAKPAIDTTYTALDASEKETPTIRLIRREAKKLWEEIDAWENSPQPVPGGIGFSLSIQEELRQMAAAAI